MNAATVRVAYVDAGEDSNDNAPPPYAARVELLEAAAELGADELHVLARIARRLAMGARQYGVLDVRSDERDFAGKEAREEVEDCLVYFACAWLKREATKGGVQ